VKTKAIHYVIAVMVAAIIGILIWQNVSTSSVEQPSLINGLSYNEDGNIDIIIPQNLFGGKNKTAEELIDEFQSSPNYPDNMIGVAPNADGTVTFTYTLEQLERERTNIYNFALFHLAEDVVSIMEVIYEDDFLTKITVRVDLEKFKDNSFERLMCSSALPMYAGIFQVLSGVHHDEWHTTITIKDADTGDIISITDYPNDDMYTAY